MRYIKHLIMALLCPVTMSAQEVYFNCDFSAYKDTLNFTVLDRDKNPHLKDIRNIKFTNGSWTMNVVDDPGNFAAISGSRCENDAPVDDWMIINPVSITSENSYLKWEAKSIHYDFRDSYKVMISTKTDDPSDFIEVYSVEEENYFWANHLISLKDYVGQDIYVAFVNVSRNKFLLAIDNIYMGELSWVKLLVDDNTSRTADANQPLNINGTIVNKGKELFINSIDCSVEDNIYSMDLNRIVKPNETIEYSFEIPVTVNEHVNYEISAESDTRHTLLSDKTYITEYKRVLLAEEYTAQWCLGCPSGTLYMHKFEERYKKDAAIVTVYNGNDLNDATYVAGLTGVIYSLPSMYYDREYIDDTNGAQLDRVLSRPVKAKINMTAEYSDDCKSVITHSTVEFAESLNNASDNYRIAYVVTEKTVTGYSQRNSLNYPAAGQFYFLPPEVLPGMLNFHKVARGTETAFNGVESSLPSNIEGKTEYTFSHEFAIPATVEDPSNISVIAIILNKRTRQAFNAWEVETLSNYTTSLKDVKESISYDLNAYKYENSLIVSLPSEADANGTSVNVYNLQGMLLSTSTYLQENVIIINDININQPLVLQCIKDGKVLGSKKILF